MRASLLTNAGAAGILARGLPAPGPPTPQTQDLEVQLCSPSSFSSLPLIPPTMHPGFSQSAPKKISAKFKRDGSVLHPTGVSQSLMHLSFRQCFSLSTVKASAIAHLTPFSVNSRASLRSLFKRHFLRETLLDYPL